MQKVSIPGGYATIRDKVTVNGREVVEQTLPAAARAIRRVKKLKDEEEIPDDELEGTVDRFVYTEPEVVALNRFTKAGVVAFLKSWTLEEPVPTTIEEVGEMDPEVYDSIIKVTAPITMTAVRRPKVSLDDGVDDQGRPIIDSPYWALDRLIRRWGGFDVDVPPGEWDRKVEREAREYLYRGRYSGLTHEQYLDEPAETVDWTMILLRAEHEAALLRHPVPGSQPPGRSRTRPK